MAQKPETANNHKAHVDIELGMFVLGEIAGFFCRPGFLTYGITSDVLEKYLSFCRDTMMHKKPTKKLIPAAT
jgi:hypothetical protein